MMSLLMLMMSLGYCSVYYGPCLLSLASSISPGNPTRPYPQDIQMRAGALGRLTSPDQPGVAEGRKGEAGSGRTLPATAMRAAPVTEMWRTN